mmetsp:Transcript_7025/g.16230  ORF Transcript_7025/g.16230 Transcript_7025/m.16230 type:complete len:889 (+) Transcript_7025:175-2841(+)
MKRPGSIPSSQAAAAVDLRHVILLGAAFEISRFATKKLTSYVEERGAALLRPDRERIREKIRPYLTETALKLCACVFVPPTLLIGASRLSSKEFGRNFSLVLSSTLSLAGLVKIVYPTRDDQGRLRDERVNVDHEDAGAREPPCPSVTLPPNLPPRQRSDSILSELSTPPAIGSTNLQSVQRKQNYLEILVHNVSHTDLVLGLTGIDDQTIAEQPFPADFERTPRKQNATKPVSNSRGGGADNHEDYIMSRPRFSAFDLFSNRLLSAITTLSRRGSTLNTVSYPRHERSGASARYTLVTPRPSDRLMVPVGFDLDHDDALDEVRLTSLDMQNLRIRGSDMERASPRGRVLPPPPFNDETDKTNEHIRISACFFPLLAVLMPTWLGSIADKFGSNSNDEKTVAPQETPNVKKVVILVSGVGVPRNWTHSVSGNSTETCAKVMELFINALYPDVVVVRLHSTTNIFRYDENIQFVAQELMPKVDQYRDAHARGQPYPDEIVAGSNAAPVEYKPFNPDWRQSVSLTYSFADGSAARSHAIQSALRRYRPAYFHFWQLKTFWHETKVTDEDIEVHSFEEMETTPAIAFDQTSDEVSRVTVEMKAFRKEFLQSVKEGGRSDLREFWLRKTRKPVLAVLLVQKPNHEPVLYRGTNMEVSMPTGSLCAERNVIGTALASDPGLKREDLKMVAVLSVRMPKDRTYRNILPPPGGMSFCQPTATATSSSDLAKEVEARPKQDVGMKKTLSMSSFTSIAEGLPSPENCVNESWEMDLLSGFDKTPTAEEAAYVETPKEGMLIPELNLRNRPSDASDGSVSGSSTPKRRIALYKKKNRNKAGGKRQTLVVQQLEDMNPLKPCGACNEWLKKIAESNPHFKVLTFTDENQAGVYVMPCQE